MSRPFSEKGRRWGGGRGGIFHLANKQVYYKALKFSSSCQNGHICKKVSSEKVHVEFQFLLRHDDTVFYLYVAEQYPCPHPCIWMLSILLQDLLCLTHLFAENKHTNHDEWFTWSVELTKDGVSWHIRGQAVWICVCDTLPHTFVSFSVLLSLLQLSSKYSMW